MKAKDPKKPFKAAFSSKIFPVVGAEKDKYLSQASLNKLQPFVPQIDASKHFDILPIAFNAYVANRMNLNDDVIMTEDAINFQESFNFKQINVEHDRNHVIGVVLNSGFSKFGSDDPFSDDELIAYLKESGALSPFNGTLGGVIWKVAAKGISDFIEEASDPSSPFYSSISASWEIYFDEFCIVAFNDKNERNLENGEIIEDEDEIYEMMGDLRAFGGSGIHKGRRIGRVVKGNILGVGIGLTETPAADVKGVEVSKSGLKTKVEDNNCSKTLENANLDNTTVNNSKDSEEKTVMKITKVEHITDENLKEAKASEITKVIADKLAETSEKYVEEQTALQNKVAEANKSLEDLQKSHETVKAELEKAKNELDTLKAEAAAQAQESKFNERMASIDEKFELSDKQREVIFKRVKAIDSDEEFAGYFDEVSAFAKEKEEKTMQISKENAEEVVANALENGETKKEALASSTNQDKTPLKDKYAAMIKVKSGTAK